MPTLCRDKCRVCFLCIGNCASGFDRVPCQVPLQGQLLRKLTRYSTSFCRPSRRLYVFGTTAPPHSHPASLDLNEKNRVENLNCQFVLMSNFLNITDDVGIGLISLVVSQLVALPRPMDTVKGGRAGHGN